MFDLVLIAAFMIIAPLVMGIKYLFRLMTGEIQEERRLWETKCQFQQSVLSGHYPSEQVLTILADLTEDFSEDGLHLVPESLGFGWCVTYGAGVERIRKKQQIEKQREWAKAKHKEVVDRFVEMLASCAKPWAELMRISKAIQGGHPPSFTDAIKYDVGQILRAISIANDPTIPRGIAELYQAIFAELEPGKGPNNFTNLDLTIEDCFEQVHRVEHKPISLPAVVNLLGGYETILGKRSPVQAVAAFAYKSLVLAACESCPTSATVVIVKDIYLNLLKPYTSAEPSSQFNCSKCATYLAVLRLNPNASEKQIRSAYRNFAKIYHPDRFEGKSEQKTAEEELKQINEAYSHLATHFESERRA